jgi:Fe-S cluster assembly scaffold protein SufB
MPTWNHLKVNYAPEVFERDINNPKKLKKYSVSPVFDDMVSGAGADFDNDVKVNASVIKCKSVAAKSGDNTFVSEYKEGVVRECLEVFEGAEAELVQIIDSENEEQLDILTQVYAHRDAKVKLYLLNLSGIRSDVRSGVAIKAEENADIEVVRIAIGSLRALYGIRSELIGDNSRCNVTTAYLADNDEILDMNDSTNFYGRETFSEIKAIGLLSGRAYKTLRETVDFKRGCVHAIGHEGEDTVMLSDEVKNLTTPLILCGEEWVEGMHAATTTRLDDDMLFYLQSRGVPLRDAKRLIIESRFSPVVDMICNEDIKSRVMKSMGERLDALSVL